MRCRLIIVIAAIVAATPACAPPGQTPDQDALLDELKAQRETIAGVVDEVDAKLAALEDEAAASGESATIAAALRSRLDEGRAVLDRLDAGIASIESEMARIDGTTEGPARSVAEAAAAARGVAPLLPPPLSEIVGIVGILLGAGASAVARSRSRQAKLASEAVRDVVSGLDAWYEASVAKGDAEEAQAARKAVRGRLSERTRPVVASAAAHPVAVGD